MKIRILLADDFAQWRGFVSSTVKREADWYIVGEASDGPEAIQKAKDLTPDVVLLDIGLPKLNGIEVARQIHKLVPQSKILFLSALDDPGIVREAMRSGASGYVVKLDTVSELTKAIKDILRGKQYVSRMKGLISKDTEDSQTPRGPIQKDNLTSSPHRHEILLCHDDAAILHSFTHFIATALSAGNPAIVLATEPHRSGLLQQLRALGVPIDTAIEQGTYIALDADEPTDAVEFLRAIKGMSEAAAKVGKKYPRVAFCGERAGRLWAAGKKDEAAQLEQLCDDLAGAENVDVLCVYPLPQGQNEISALNSIFAEHTAASYR